MIETILQDLHYGVRQLARAPGFTAVAIITLALGIGANTAIFSAVSAVLLEPLPYRDTERIMTLWQRDLQTADRAPAAPANFLDWRERSRSFEAIAAVEPFSNDYLGPDGPQRFRSWLATEDFFTVFRVAPLAGRTFEQADHVPGAPRVLVLGHDIWQSRFGGDRNVVGRVLNVDGQPTTVIGIMPPGFAYPPGRDLWLPRVPQGWEPQNRAATFWWVAAKLNAGVTREAAQAELDGIAAQLAVEYAATNADSGIAAVPLRDNLVGRVRPALLLFLGAVGLVLLIACVNVANLLLARAAARKREFAIRAVLGAGRRRMIRQLVTESLVLAGLGGALGLGLGAAGLVAFQSLQPTTLPRGAIPAIDGSVVLFTCALALGSAFLFGLVPALQAARSDLRERLHAGALADPTARNFRGALVVSELAFATVLLIGAGLLIRSFVALLDVERGFRTENVLALTVQAWRHYPDAVQRALFVEQTVERVATLPGVLAVGATSSLPLAEAIGAEQASLAIVGRPLPGGELLTAHAAIVAGNYFDALGIALRRGRLFAATDDRDAPRVVVINEASARRYWADQDPIGTTVRLAVTGEVETAEVIGVVADVRHSGLDEEPQPSVFLPHSQFPTGALHFTVRTAADPAPLVRAIQEEIWTMNPAMPFAGVTTLDDLLETSLGGRRLTLLLLGVFAATALALAVIGTYGVLSYESTRRSHEIGVRMALGAQPGRVLRLVVGEGLRLAAIGIAIGAVLAFVVTRYLSRFLFGVSALDPMTFIGIALLLLAATTVASYVPAFRAARVNPMVSVRAE